MKFTNVELKAAMRALEESDNRAAQKMSQWLAEVVDDPECDGFYDLINRDHYVATILWNFNDIKEALKERGFCTTDENADLVYAELIPEVMEDCSAGWDHIYATIDRLEEMELLEKEGE